MRHDVSWQPGEISSKFYVRVFCTKVLFSSYVLAKKHFRTKKRVHKMLMKLIPVQQQ